MPTRPSFRYASQPNQSSEDGPSLAASWLHLHVCSTLRWLCVGRYAYTHAAAHAHDAPPNPIPNPNNNNNIHTGGLPERHLPLAGLCGGHHHQALHHPEHPRLLQQQVQVCAFLSDCIGGRGVLVSKTQTHTRSVPLTHGLDHPTLLHAHTAFLTSTAS